MRWLLDRLFPSVSRVLRDRAQRCRSRALDHASAGRRHAALAKGLQERADAYERRADRLDREMRDPRQPQGP